MLTLENIWIGHRVTDCIGLLKYYVMSDGYGAVGDVGVQFIKQKKLAPSITDIEIDQLRQTVAGEVNKGREAITT